MYYVYFDLQYQAAIQAQFPYLNTESLTPDQKSQLIGRLEFESDEMKEEFIALVTETSISLEGNNVNPNHVFLILSGFGIPGLSKREAISINISKIYNSCSFFNYAIIKTIIDQLGDDTDKERLFTYEEKFKKYCQRRICEIPTGVFKSDLEAKVTLHVKTDKNFNVPADDIHSLGSKLSNLLNTTLLLLDVKDGCVELYFDCLKAGYLQLLQKNDHTEAFKRLGIIKICTDNQVFYEELGGEFQHSFVVSGSIMLLVLLINL